MNTSILNGQKILLIDAIGAVASALSLLIPYSFDELFGIPKNTVSIFIGIAIVCSVYSSTIYLIKPKNWKRYLAIIALINIGYCIFTGYHMFKNLNTLTLPGYLYFATEILIILTLSSFELKLSRTKTNH